MKFAEHLASHLTPEWRKQYINYDKMKKMLYVIVQKIPTADETDDSELRRRFLTQKEEEFLKYCLDELNKINLFFNQKLAEAQTKSRDLIRDIEALRRLSQAKMKQRTAEPTQLHGGLVQRLRRASNIPVAIGAAMRRGSYMEQDDVSISTNGVSLAHVTYDKALGHNLAGTEDHRLPKTMRECRSAFAEFYLSLVLLQNYQQLNCTGFRKILKKHDKLLQTDRGHLWCVENVASAPFAVNKEIDKLIVDTEHIVIERLEKGNRQAAMKRLRVPPLNEVQSVWTTFRLGFFIGSFLILAFLIVLTIFLQSRPHEPRWVAVRLYRGFFLLFANIFFMGLNMYGWQSSGVNHVLIFEIDPRDHMTYQTLMEISAFFMAVWALCVLGYLHHDNLFCPPTIFPLILLTVCLLWLFNPLPVGRKSSRFWFLRHVLNCFTAPFQKVGFMDFWLADQMNSLITFFLDMQYFACFYLNYVDYNHQMKILITNVSSDVEIRSTLSSLLPPNSTIPFLYDHQRGINIETGEDICITNAYGIRPVISCLPALIRFLQCLRRYKDSKKRHPHLTNAGKYAATFFIVIFGSLNTYYKASAGDNGFFYIWVLSYVVSFVYTLIWDIKMDWSLLETNKRGAQHRFLRDDIIYQQYLYYLAMIEDAVLRLAWVLNVSSGDAWFPEIDLLIFITAPLEIVRRFIWNFFRLENEHVNNCGQFRATRDIHIAPISRPTDWSDVERKMDDDEGVTHRSDQYSTLHDVKLKSSKGGRRMRFKRKLAQTLAPISQVSFGSFTGRNLTSIHHRGSTTNLVKTSASTSILGSPMHTILQTQRQQIQQINQRHHPLNSMQLSHNNNNSGKASRQSPAYSLSIDDTLLTTSSMSNDQSRTIISLADTSASLLRKSTKFSVGPAPILESISQSVDDETALAGLHCGSLNDLNLCQPSSDTVVINLPIENVVEKA